MSRKPILLLLLLVFSLPVVGQNIGDLSSAGFNNTRTYANVDLATVRPPFRLFETVTLSGINNANTLAVFENQFLVGQPGSSPTPITYKLFTRQGGTVWTKTMVGSSPNFRFVPAFSNSIVILGGESTASIRAVKILDGSDLWSDFMGNTSGRFPAVTDNYAIYAGTSKIAAKTLAGAAYWQAAATTAASALTVRDDSLYFLTLDRALNAVNLALGTPKWAPVANVASEGASLVASEKYVFVNDQTSSLVRAINAATGLPLWSQTGFQGTFATEPALALAFVQLYVFRSNNGSGNAAVDALDANTGVRIWSITEEGSGLANALLADATLYYYHAGQIRARDAITGALLWSIAKADVKALGAANGELYALLGNAIEVYVPIHEIYMAQMANGSGQTTLVMLANTGGQAVDARVYFVDDDGNPVTVPVKSAGTKSQVDVTVPPYSSVGIQTEDKGGALVVGWVRVVSDGKLRGMTNFQYSQQQEIVREAGVADSRPIGAANVYISVSGGFNAGVAIANPTGQNAEVGLTLLNSSAVELASKTVLLAAGGHLARFVNEFFKDQVGSAFEGTLVIESQVPVVITAIRTKGGIQISSYPVGQAVR